MRGAWRIPVVPIPGCCAAVCALAASGHPPTGRWCFEGFLSVNKKARRAPGRAARTKKRTMIFYEAPLAVRHPARPCGHLRRGAPPFPVRELTKLHEETLRMTLDEAVQYFDAHPPRGDLC